MLETKRNEINAIDDEIISLLNKRFQVTDEIGIYKKENNIAVLNDKREQEIYEKIKGLELKNENDILKIYKFLLDLSKTRQENLKLEKN